MHRTYFTSGASALSDLRGLARASVPLGVSLSELSPTGLHVLLAFAVMPLLKIFVDSGAFSEVDRVGNVVAEITGKVWCERVGVMMQIAAAFGARAHVVGPDRVGDQKVTLVRLRTHAWAIRRMHAAGARVVVPIQRGEMTAADFDRAAADVLGFDDFVRGIPGNKVAMPELELATYLRARRPAAVHLLGVGPRGPRYRGLVDVLSRFVPTAEVSCDSNALTANAGHTNGRGGKARRLTAWQEHHEGRPSNVAEPPRSPPAENARELAVLMAFGPANLYRLFVEQHGDLIGVRDREPPLQRGLFDSVDDAEGME